MKTPTPDLIRTLAGHVAAGKTFAEAARLAKVKPEVARQWLLRGQGRVPGRPAEGPYLALSQAMAEAERMRGLLVPGDANVDRPTRTGRPPAPANGPSPLPTGQEPVMRGGERWWPIRREPPSENAAEPGRANGPTGESGASGVSADGGDDPTVFVREPAWVHLLRLWDVFFPGPSWARWRVCFKAMHALPLTEDEMVLYRHHTGRERPPAQPVKKFYGLIGRKGGKSEVASKILLLHVLPLLRLPDAHNVVAMCLAQDRRGARIVFDALKGVTSRVPRFAEQVQRETAEVIEFTNRLAIEVRPNSGKGVRGPMIPISVLDEAAHWPTDDWSAKPDVETVAALVPGMLPFPDRLLLCISSVHIKRGILWEAFKNYFGKDEESDRDEVLVWRATSTEMNPLLPADEIAKELERDPARGRAEYLSIFREDIELLISESVLDPSRMGSGNGPR